MKAGRNPSGRHRIGSWWWRCETSTGRSPWIRSGDGIRSEVALPGAVRLARIRFGNLVEKRLLLWLGQGALKEWDQVRKPIPGGERQWGNAVFVSDVGIRTVPQQEF